MIVDFLEVDGTEKVHQVLEKFGSYCRENKEGVPIVVVNHGVNLQSVLTNGDFRRLLQSSENALQNVRIYEAFDLNTKNYIGDDESLYLFDNVRFIQNIKAQIDQSLSITSGSVEWIAVTSNCKIKGFVSWAELDKPNLLNTEVFIHGMGFVGLSLAVVLAAAGLAVQGIEVDPRQLATISEGIAPFEESGLSELLKSGLAEGRLSFSDSLASCRLKKQFAVHVICVGTDIDGQGEIDLTPLSKIIRDISAFGEYDCIIIRSTVGLGHTRSSIASILDDFQDFSFCPERLAEGSAIEELSNIPQLVGAQTERAKQFSELIFGASGSPVIHMESVESAELAKLAMNSVRDVTFAVTNALIPLAASHNIDLTKMVSQANTEYPRTKLARPSHVVGGYCLTKDPVILASQYGPGSQESSFFHIGRKINSNGLEYCLSIYEQEFSDSEKKLMRILLVGIAFKGLPANSDGRGNYVNQLLNRLRKDSKDVYAYDAVISGKVVTENFDMKSWDNNSHEPLAIFVLNNHPKNVGVVKEAINRNGVKFVFDPWSLINGKLTDCDQDFIYVNLTKKLRVNRIFNSS